MELNSIINIDNTEEKLNQITSVNYTNESYSIKAFEKQFPFDQEKYQNILDDITRSKKLNMQHNTKQNANKKKENEKKLVEKTKSFKERMKFREQNYNGSRVNRSKDGKKKVFKIEYEYKERSKENKKIKKGLTIQSTYKNINNRSRSANKSKNKVLQINIKTILKEIIDENKNKPEDYINKIKTANFTNRKKEIEEKSFEDFMLLSKTATNRKRNKSSISLVIKKAETNNFLSNRSKIVTKLNSPSVSIKSRGKSNSPGAESSSRQIISLIKKNKSLNKSLNPNETNKKNIDFDQNKIFRPQIKFSYLWDLLEMCEKRKVKIAEKKLIELINKNDQSPVAHCRNNSKNVNHGKQTIIQSKSINQLNKPNSKNERIFNDRIYSKYNKKKDNNYLTNYYINKKNKLLEEILSKNLSTKEDNFYKKNIEWLNLKNENRIKLENKLKKEALITDDNERLLKGFLKSENEKEVDISTLISEGINSPFSTGINYDELIKELTKNIETNIYDKIQNFSVKKSVETFSKNEDNKLKENSKSKIDLNKFLKEKYSQNLSQGKTESDTEKIETIEENSTLPLKSSQRLTDFKTNTIRSDFNVSSNNNKIILVLDRNRKNSINDFKDKDNFKILNINTD